MASVIETVNLVDAGEVADEIVKRLACNELSQQISDHIREMAEHGSLYFTHMIGYGPTPLQIVARFNPDGSLRLELTDCNACPVWQTTLKAPPAPRQVHVTHQVHCQHDDSDESPF